MGDADQGSEQVEGIEISWQIATLPARCVRNCLRNSAYGSGTSAICEDFPKSVASAVCWCRVRLLRECRPGRRHQHPKGGIRPDRLPCEP
jgi:hypothetical protein